MDVSRAIDPEIRMSHTKSYLHLFCSRSANGRSNFGSSNKEDSVSTLNRSVSSVTVLLSVLLFGGCSLDGAPSYSLFGAFFPAWLLCAVLGLVAAFIFRTCVIAADLEEAMPFKLLVYTAFGAGLAVWLWLALFGEG